MFESLIGFWSGKDFLAHVLDDFAGMLKTAEQMYSDVMMHFCDDHLDADFVQGIYERDRSINTLERKIRRRIIEHLAVRPKVSLSVCLILMSVVKDAERLGDYAKNLLEAADVMERPLARSEFERFYGDVPQKIMTSFEETAKAFVESDEARARSVVRCLRDVASRCEQLWRDLANSDLSANHAVCLAVSARYNKRVALHLANIATAVIMPVTDLDYWDEDLISEGESKLSADDTHPGFELT